VVILATLNEGKHAHHHERILGKKKGDVIDHIDCVMYNVFECVRVKYIKMTETYQNDKTKSQAQQMRIERQLLEPASYQMASKNVSSR